MRPLWRIFFTWNYWVFCFWIKRDDYGESTQENVELLFLVYDLNRVSRKPIFNKVTTRDFLHICLLLHDMNRFLSVFNKMIRYLLKRMPRFSTEFEVFKTSLSLSNEMTMRNLLHNEHYEFCISMLLFKNVLVQFI